MGLALFFFGLLVGFAAGATIVMHFAIGGPLDYPSMPSPPPPPPEPPRDPRLDRAWRALGHPDCGRLLDHLAIAPCGDGWRYKEPT